MKSQVYDLDWIGVAVYIYILWICEKRRGGMFVGSMS